MRYRIYDPVKDAYIQDKGKYALKHDGLLVVPVSGTFSATMAVESGVSARTVERSTEKKDKFEQEIYENDIVEAWGHNGPVRGPVTWDVDNACWLFASYTWKDLSSIEVCGTTHDALGKCKSSAQIEDEFTHKFNALLKEYNAKLCFVDRSLDFVGMSAVLHCGRSKSVRVALGSYCLTKPDDD